MNRFALAFVSVIVGSPFGFGSAVEEVPQPRARASSAAPSEPRSPREPKKRHETAHRKVIRAACWRHTNAQHAGYWNTHPELAS
ncbi:MAG: hypothetical protein HOV80_22115 [Polyangiaceae bacterium]|nr:hypothetical protein [Polyangiaceae bacterium]